MDKLTVKDIDVKGKRCLVRVDFNVPMKDGVITDENRINGALPTIKYLVDQGAKVILCSHMGKPHNVLTPGWGLNKKEKAKLEAMPEADRPAAEKEMMEKAAKDRTKLSLKPVAVALSKKLGQEVKMSDDFVGPCSDKLVSEIKDGEVILLENTRFDKGEEKRDEALCKKLASYCDVYVNDAFGTAHRSHATTAAIVEYGFVKTAVCGFLIEKELSVMADTLENPARPFVAILGGAKVADKLNVIDNLLNKCDTLIIGGGMSYTFLKAMGYEVGTSLLDETKIDYCKDMMEKAKKLGKKFLLPIDVVTTAEFPDPIDGPIETAVCDADKIPADRMGMDIGPKTRKLYADAVASAKSVIWNGPMGVFENPTLAAGTMSVAKALADAKDAITIIGGGDSAAAVAQLGFADKMTHISTGGGASLEFLEGKTLPDVACLDEK